MTEIGLERADWVFYLQQQQLVGNDTDHPSVDTVACEHYQWA
ncbi:MAG: hypothetical protein ACI9WS_003274 [Paraglaciecola psychrophila]